jgi:hypothetical protein
MDIKAGLAGRSVNFGAWTTATGAPVTITPATTGLSLWYRRGVVGAKVAISPVAFDPVALTTAWTSGGILVIEGAEHRLDLPDAAIAAEAGVLTVSWGGSATGITIDGGTANLIGQENTATDVNQLSATDLDLILKTSIFALAIADAIADEVVTSGHAVAGSVGVCLNTLAAVAARTNNANLNALLGVIDSSGQSVGNLVGLAYNRLGGWTGTGNNTVLGALKALMSKVYLTVSDIGGTYDSTTDSTEALRERGDAAWATATGFATAAACTEARLAELDAVNLPAAADAAAAVAVKLNTGLVLNGDVWQATSNFLELAPGGAGATYDWTADERTQIRSALGIDGTKTTAAGGQLQTIVLKTSLIVSGGVTIQPGPVTGLITVYHGDSYAADQARQLSWPLPSPPDLTLAESVTLSVYPIGSETAVFETAATWTGAGTANQLVLVALTVVQTDLLTVGYKTFYSVLRATYPGDNVVTLQEDEWIVGPAGAARSS